MIKFKNCFTGTDMWVAEDRADEYKAAGHKLVAEMPREGGKSSDTAKKTAATAKSKARSKK